MARRAAVATPHAPSPSLLMCSHCRCYAAQIRAIGTAVRSLFQKPGEDAKILERLRETILGRPETKLDPSENRAISRPRQPRQTRPRPFLLAALAPIVIVAHPHFHLTL